jgi:sec-independent protein translocase protein TatB
MFDIGFSEIVVIFGLALVVLGPDKLPKVAATVGRWVGRARAMARQFTDQLQQEADNLKSDVHVDLGTKPTAQEQAHVTPSQPVPAAPTPPAEPQAAEQAQAGASSPLAADPPLVDAAAATEAPRIVDTTPATEAPSFVDPSPKDPFTHRHDS